MTDYYENLKQEELFDYSGHSMRHQKGPGSFHGQSRRICGSSTAT